MKRFTSMLVGLVLLVSSLLAQDIQITGKVTNVEDGGPLPGVTVVVKSLETTGTITNIDGEYEITAPSDAVLVFSFIGMETKEELIAGRAVIDVALAASRQQMDEVVITAFGISREKKSLGYAIQEVEGDDIARTKDVNVINSLSGKVAGVQIRNNTNMGGSSNIIIRGSSSLVGSNQALFIVDGVPMSNYNSNNLGQTEGRSGYDYGNPV
ncbi:MAG: carboxypeptidase-like regulatory domain-containing protein, partial [Bacteroidales bacterium]|nr:carboxypeptidase-like regulatory domain-containing protein [Bacteroidales bacterium]